MKLRSLIFSLCLFGAINSNGATYYVSSSAGNDTHSQEQAKNSSTPWKSLSRINKILKYLHMGDSILFKKGDVFYGHIDINKSGGVFSPLYFGAYGKGSKPVISGFKTVNNWKSLGNNIWESLDTVTSLSSIKVVSIGGVNTAMGRYPNTGYLTYQSHSSNNSISSESLGSTDWTNAEVVIKKNRYSIESGTITKHSGKTLFYTDANLNVPTDGFGFFIQNDVRTLDKQNEWFFNSKSKKLFVYSVGKPADVKVSSIERLVNGDWKVGEGNYLHFENIAFRGANANALHFSYKRYITVKDCDISFVGQQGIYTEGVTFSTIANNVFNEINGNAMRFTSTSTNALVSGNSVKNSGMIPGVNCDWAFGSVSISGDNSLVEYNTIDSSGYNGIFFSGDNTIIKNNYIKNSCLLQDDGGAIYTAAEKVGRKIIGNIILNTIGNFDGTNDKNAILAHGIYVDEKGSMIDILNNTVSGSKGSGIFVHEASDITIENNILFDNGVENNFAKGALMAQQGSGGVPVRNLKINNNTFFAKTANQLCLFYYSTANDINQFALAANNTYARPLNNNNYINAWSGAAQQWPGTFHNSSNWPYEKSSKSYSNTASSENDLRFEYNASTSAKTIKLDRSYRDTKGDLHQKEIKIEPYSSAILIASNQAITKLAQNIEFSTIPQKTYGDQPFELLAKSSSGLPIDFKIIEGSAKVDGNIITIAGTGKVIVEAAQPGNDLYETATTVTRELLINKADPSIAFEVPSSKVLGDSPFALEAGFNEAYSPINFESSDSTIVSIDKQSKRWVATVKKEGIATITARLPENDFYKEAKISRSLTVQNPVLAQVNGPSRLETYPNPFVNHLNVEYQAQESSEASLKVYNLQGRVIRDLYEGPVKAGETKSFRVEANDLIAGTYIVRLTTPQRALTQKVILSN